MVETRNPMYYIVQTSITVSDIVKTSKSLSHEQDQTTNNFHRDNITEVPYLVQTRTQKHKVCMINKTKYFKVCLPDF